MELSTEILHRLYQTINAGRSTQGDAARTVIEGATIAKSRIRPTDAPTKLRLGWSWLIADYLTGKSIEDQACTAVMSSAQSLFYKLHPEERGGDSWYRFPKWNGLKRDAPEELIEILELTIQDALLIYTRNHRNALRFERVLSTPLSYRVINKYTIKVDHHRYAYAIEEGLRLRPPLDQIGPPASDQLSIWLKDRLRVRDLREVDPAIGQFLETVLPRSEE